MSDTIGRITVPSITASGTFPLVTRWPHGRAQKRPVVVHTLGAASAKLEQRFLVGSTAVRYILHLPNLNRIDRAALRDFWEGTQGAVGAFTYAVPQENGTTVNTTVCFENQPLTFEELTDAITQVNGLTLVAIPDPAAAPSYTLNGTDTRFPGSTLTAALLSQVQQMIPLVRIRVLDSAVPDIFLSDQRCTIGGQIYLPRLLRVGETGNEPLVTQSIDGSSDDVTLVFGNADRVMVQLANDTQLRWGRMELSFFHVGTGIKLDLWAGYIQDWNSDPGPEFPIRASDILSALTLSSPVQTASRTCFRRYGLDGCPAVPGSQAMDTTHFPSSTNASCDFGYNTPNGCMAHQVEQSFGASFATPQSVFLLSQPGGGGFLSPTSIINDTIWGDSVPEIWHDDEGIAQYGLPVACKVVDGRDESDFYDALGIIGAGPLGALTAAQMYDSNGDGIPDTFLGCTLDGQPNHGFQVDSLGHLKSGANPALGLRTVLGSDPAGSNDYFSLGRVSASSGGYPIGPRGWFANPADSSPMDEVYNAGSSYNLIFAAGLAFVELRRSDTAGIQPSLPSSHQLIAMVSKGLTGYYWTAPGSRSTLGGMTDPFWVAVNTFLRALGNLGLSAGAQEAYFDVAAAIASSSVAATTVAKVFGTGTEKQFQFKGTLDKRQPTRDYLRAILNSALGYYTWSFGKLRVGCRFNASAQSAYTSGNTIFGSLVLQPVKPGFEKLTVTFNDQEYLFASNTVEYIDRDCAARNGRVQNPLESEFPLTGTSSKSQAARIALGRAREELGGAVQAEQDRSRQASWRTTILGLDTEAGMVVSQTDPDIPGPTGTCNVTGGAVLWQSGDQFSAYLINKQVLINGVLTAFSAVADATHATVSPAPGNGTALTFQVITADFRVQSWRLNRDFSIDITAKSVVPSMYDLTVGPKPADVAASPVPTDTGRDAANPPAPLFSIRANPADGTQLEIYGLGFADSRDTQTVFSGALGIYWVDDSVTPPATITASIISTDASVSLSSVTGISAGTILLLDRELVLCGAPSGLSVPITRAQLGSTAASHSSSTGVRIVQTRTSVFAWPSASALASWKWEESLVAKTVVAVTCFATNDYGDGDLAIICETGVGSHGLALVGFISVTTPDAPHAVLLTEIGPRALKNSDQSTYTVLQAIVQETIAGNLGTKLTLQISSDNGATWGTVGDYTPDHLVADEDGTHTYYQTTIPIPNIFVMTTAQNYKARAWSSNSFADPGTPGAVASSTCVVNAIGVPSATCGTAFITGGVTKAIDQTTGLRQWVVNFRVDTTGAGDAYAFQVTRQNGDGSGTFATQIPGDTSATEGPVVDFANDGKTHQVTLTGYYQPSGSPYTFVRFKVYGFSRTASVATPINSWKDPTYSVLQQWGGLFVGSTFVDVGYGDIDATTSIAGQGSNLIANPGAELGLAGWKTGGSFFTTTTGQARTLTHSFTPTSIVGAADALLWQRLPSLAGQRVNLSAWIKGDSGNGVTVTLELVWRDTSGTQIGSISVVATATSPTTTFTQFSGADIAPSGTATVDLQVRAHYVSGSGTVYVDDVYGAVIITSDLLGPGAVTNPAIGAGAVTAPKTSLAAIDASTGAVAANHIVDAMVLAPTSGGGINVSKLNSGTNIFTGDVVLSRGTSLPVIILSSSAMTLFGQADASTGATGLTSKPYVQIQNTGMLIHSGANASINLNAAAGIVLYTVNGSTTNPYVNVFGSGILVSNGGSSSVLINGSGVTIVGGILTSPAITVTAGSGTVNMDPTNTFQVTDTGVRVFIKKYTGFVGSAGLQVDDNSGASTPIRTEVGPGFVTCVSSGALVPGTSLKTDGLYVKSNLNKTVGTRMTGWTVWTGTATRTGFATSTATLQNVAETLKALIDDLHATAGHGLIGT